MKKSFIAMLAIVIGLAFGTVTFAAEGTSGTMTEKKEEKKEEKKDGEKTKSEKKETKKEKKK